MEIYSTEEQQVDAIKQFWKDYGTSIVVGAVVGLGGLFGWNYYSEHKIAQAELASEAFQAVSAGNISDTSMLAAAENFAKDHSQKGYQSLLELIVAKAAVEAGDLDKAEATLKSVVSSAPDKGLVMVATMRLARVQAEQGQITTAITTLDQVSDPAFTAQRDELKGDFLVRKGDEELAKAAYQAAVKNGGTSVSPALQMKLDNLNKA
ncbi:tetratricopeptide repeat protein [Shewanella benthica]|uniref:tetratricopeptide repeat protein n=1 Tax=Shewanella benthica TaxID=43661 RepID=UPI00187A3031|nr:tetratricopeptide repeat protein [Shewanella benthica]MBE7215900.1 tetratricopeptide repeat protein [Shewanella benthica]MBL4815117.1 tetratricopeptide repeat protein [Shewanella sp.]MCL1063592.1 tetratricopeptide repeat protein [Shewanella benthica]